MPSPLLSSHSRWPVLLLLAAALGGCGALKSTPSPRLHERFDSEDTYSRSYDVPPAQACEAARRALLGQGFAIVSATADLVNGRKNFQPVPESHVQVDLRVVCAPDGATGTSAIAFVSALEDKYTVKKSNSSASVGVGAIGSLSLPFIGSDDSLVKIASETVQDAAFYKRFFTLLERHLPDLYPANAATPPVAAAPKPADTAPAAKP